MLQGSEESDSENRKGLDKIKSSRWRREGREQREITPEVRLGMEALTGLGERREKTESGATFS